MTAYRFDEVLIVDWSASSRPSPQPAPDSIWIGRTDANGTEARHFPTRRQAEAWLLHSLHVALAGHRRLLVGFDFAFGYPSGFARTLTGKDTAQSVWSYLDHHIQDGNDNQNNRFAVAAAMNAHFPTPGPFWGGSGDTAIPPRKPPSCAELAEHRQAETKGAKSVWQLTGAGAVGSQSLMGQPMLHRLCAATGAKVWPFDPVAGPLIFAEVYPSLLRPAVQAETARGWITDAAQVRLLSRALWLLSRDGGLAALFNTIPALAAEEGAILGAVHASELLDALRWP